MVEVVTIPSVSESSTTSSSSSSFALTPPQHHQDTSMSSTSSSMSSLSLEDEIANTRAQLATLREERQRQRTEQAQQIHKLHYQYESLQHSLQKNSDRLNMFLYTHAMLQAQTTVVQPYILKQQAMLCHAFHHNEVLTKQIHLRRLHCDALVAVLEHSRDQIVDFWQPRLWYCTSKLAQVQHDIHQYRNHMPPISILRCQQEQRFTSRICHDNHIVVVEEEVDDDVDDELSCSSSSTAQSDASSHQDVLYQVISMALAVVTEGRLSSVFDKKTSYTLCSKATAATAPSKKLDVIWEEATTMPLRRSLVGFETI